MHPFLSTNHVKSAVRKAGGTTKVANALGVSGTSVGNWIRQQRISDMDKAKMLAKMTGFRVEDLRPCR
jgi:DNA-binding transcriptional regulator YdaS (Cro superfamily)